MKKVIVAQGTQVIIGDKTHYHGDIIDIEDDNWASALITGGSVTEIIKSEEEEKEDANIN